MLSGVNNTPSPAAGGGGGGSSPSSQRLLEDYKKKKAADADYNPHNDDANWRPDTVIAEDMDENGWFKLDLGNGAMLLVHYLMTAIATIAVISRPGR
eukprot:COSAG05_NODE_4147_length_1652_cov_8.323815_2_plen_97_part_00